MQMTIKLFISHDWVYEQDYLRARSCLDKALGEEWRDLSVPRTKAIRIANKKSCALQDRISAALHEKGALLERSQKITDNINQIECLLTNHELMDVQTAISNERQKLEDFANLLPNPHALQRHVEQPLANLKKLEEVMRARSLLNKTPVEAIRILSNERVAADASVCAQEINLKSLAAELETCTESEQLIDMSSLNWHGKPPPSKLAVDRILAEQISSLVAQSDVVILITHAMVMYKPWIHFELTLAVRHNRPIVAILERRHKTENVGLIRDLASFGAVLSCWNEFSQAVQARTR